MTHDQPTHAPAKQDSRASPHQHEALEDIRACPSANSRPTGAFVAGTRGSGDECGARARPRTTLTRPRSPRERKKAASCSSSSPTTGAYGMWLHDWLGPAATPPLHSARRRRRQHRESPDTADPAAAFPSIPTAASAMLGRPSNTQHTSSYPARTKHMGAQV